MKKHTVWQWISVNVFLALFTVSAAYGHGGGGGSNGDLTEVSFVPNPNVLEFASATGTALVNLTEGVVELEDLQGFPFDPTRNRILPITVTSSTDPRLHSEAGEPSPTSCHPTSVSDSQEPVGPWTCHVHSYVVWLAELEDGVLSHPIPLSTIFPRTDGTAADRNFSFREGDVSGFGANVVIITAEVTIGGQQSVAQSSDGALSIQLAPRGPIVLQANLSGVSH